MHADECVRFLVFLEQTDCVAQTQFLERKLERMFRQRALSDGLNYFSECHDECTDFTPVVGRFSRL